MQKAKCKMQNAKCKRGMHEEAPYDAENGASRLPLANGVTAPDRFFASASHSRHTICEFVAECAGVLGVTTFLNRRTG